jgi:glycerophosphoryl diester phosphodiesterase
MGFAKHALLGDEFRVVAYRGGANERPENTLAAFEHAASLSKSIVIELDVRRTRDGVLVAMHDDDVSRTTNGTGRVSELDYGRLRSFDAGYRFEKSGQLLYRGCGIAVPTVSEVLARLPEQLLVLDVHGTHPSIARCACSRRALSLTRMHAENEFGSGSSSSSPSCTAYGGWASMVCLHRARRRFCRRSLDGSC